MHPIRKRLTYANVMSSIAVFLLVGGGAAFAATQLPKNSVGTKQLKKNAVTAAKIKKNAIVSGKIKVGAVSGEKLADGSVTEGKIADGSITGAKIKDGSLTGSDVNQATLDSVKAANVYAATFDAGPNNIVNPSDPGIKSGGCFFVCVVEFPRVISTCSATASSAGPVGGTGEAAMAEVFPSSSNNKAFLVVMWNDEGNITGHDFAITVVCPSTS